MRSVGRFLRAVFLGFYPAATEAEGGGKEVREP